jgi:hypothetical protein
MIYEIKNWLKKHTVRGRLRSVEAQFKPSNGWDPTIKHDVQELTTWISKLQGEVNYLDGVIKESGIVEQVDVSDIKFKETKHTGNIFGSYITREAYQVNKVKVK